MSDPNHEHAQRTVLYVANDAIIPDAMLPELPQPGALERLPNTARIVEYRHAVMQKLQNSSRDRLIELG